MTEATTVSDPNDTPERRWEKWVDYIRYSLAELWVDADEWGVDQVLNRIPILFQRPVVLIVGQLDGSAFRSIRLPVREPLFRGAFEEAVRAYEENVQSDCLFQIMETAFYLVAFTVEQTGRPGTYPSSVSYQPIARGDPIGRFLGAVLAPPREVMKDLGAQDHFQAAFARSLLGPSQFRSASNDNVGQDVPPASPNIWSAACAQLIDHVETQFQYLARSPIMSPDGRRPANLLLIAKLFDPQMQRLRFDAYKYDCRLLLGPTQENELREVFSRCRNDRPGRGDWLYRAYCESETGERTDIAHERIPACPLPGAEKAFWDYFEQHGPDGIVDLLKSPLGANTRLCVEYVLTSGLTLVNREPFKRGDIGWLHPERGRQSRQVIERERVRLTALYHLFQLMAPTRRPLPSLLMLPISANNATWCSFVTVRGGADIGFGGSGNDLVDEAWAQRTYLTYHALARPFERRLRRHSLTGYVRLIGDILSFHIDRQMSDGAIFQKEEFYKRLNADLREVTRVYPYHQVRVSGRPASVPAHYLTSDASPLPLCITLEDNDFFDRLQMGPALKFDELLPELWSVIRGRLPSELVANLGTPTAE